LASSSCGTGKLCIAFVILRASVVEEAERHIDIGFDQLRPDAIGSSMIVGIRQNGPPLVARKYCDVFRPAAAMKAQP
jgi:hypothetical protein